MTTRTCSILAEAALLAALSGGCRAVIGYDAIAYEAEAGGGGDGGCPTTPPAVLFTTKTPLAVLFTGGGTVYANLVNDDGYGANLDAGLLPDPFVGLLACAATGCGGSASTLFEYTTLVDGAGWGAAIASDASLYYSLPTARYDLAFTDASVGTVVRASLDGTNGETIAAHLAYPLLLAVSGDTVFWGDDPATLTASAQPHPWRVLAAAAGGGEGPPSVVMTGYPFAPIEAIFADDENVYVYAGDAMNNLGVFVCAVASGGSGGCDGEPTELVSGLMYASSGFPQDSFAADGTSLFQAGSDTGAITQYDIATHVPTSLASGQSGAANLVLGGDTLYWSTASGLIESMPKTGGTPSLAACGLTGVSALAVSGGRLYFVANDPKTTSGFEVASVPTP